MDATIRKNRHPQPDEESTKATSDEGQQQLPVLIIGAGAAGLTAGYDLKRRNIPFRILEANATTIGGRLRKLEGFADYPLDLGAEWVHTDPSILKTIVDDDDTKVNVDIPVEEHDTETHRVWTTKGRWKESGWDTAYDLYRFKSTTWFDFFNDFIAPHKDISCGCVVDTIDYSSDNENGSVRVTCCDGRTFVGSQVIVTVGINILQSNDISFIPCLPAAKRRAIDRVPFESGMKMFIEFSKQFYFKGGFEIETEDEKEHGDVYFWNESTLKESGKHILGVFIYGEKSHEFVGLEDKKVIAKILTRLDAAFDGKASENYIQHHLQNWTKDEPFIRGLYTSYRNGLRPMYTIMRPVNNKIFFAGEALPTDGCSYGYAHGAALSGRNAAKQVQCVRSGMRLPLNIRAMAVHALSTVCMGLEHRLFFNEDD